MQVKEIMTHHTDCLSPDSSIQKASEVMQKGNSGFLPIEENERLVGVVTDRDI